MRLFPLFSSLLLTSALFAQQQATTPNPAPAATTVRSASPTATAVTSTTPAVDRGAFTFTDYKLKLQFNLPTQSLGVRGTITIRNDSTTPQRTIPLQISSQLHWASLRLPGKETSFSVHRLDSDIDHSGAVNEATITLPEPLAPGASVALEVGYEGALPRDTGRLDRIDTPPALARHSDWDQITTSSIFLRGVGYVVWYPVSLKPAKLSEGPQMFEEVNAWKLAAANTSMDLEIVVHGADAANTFFVNGQIVSIKKQAAGESVDLTAESHIDAIGFNTPTLLLANRETLTTPAAVVYYATEDKARASQYAAAAADTAKLLADWFGSTAAHPLQIVELDDPNDAPFAFGATLLTPFASGNNQELLPMALAYPMTHGYFDSRRLWMREGLAWFMQVTELEQSHGRAVALKYLQDRLGGLTLAEPEGGSNDASTSLIHSSQEIFFRDKAVFVWWMLRDLVGESTLQRALRAYRPEQDTQPAYFQKLLEKESQKNLEWFFDDWVYRDKGLPELKIDSTFARRELNGAYLVTVGLSNSGAAGAEVPVTVRTEAGDASARVFVPGGQKGAAHIEVTVAPVEATINDGSVPEIDSGDHTAQLKIKQEQEPDEPAEQSQP